VLKYTASRVLAIVPVLLGVSVAVFLMLHVLPADPVQVMFVQTSSGQVPSPQAAEQMMAQLRQQLGLDKPLYMQFLQFLQDVVTGSFGRSYRSQEPVSQMVAAQYPYTVRLALAALACSIVLGLGFGILAGLRPGSWVDRLSMIIASVGISAPIFWIGLMLIFVFAVTLNLLPVLGTGSPQALILPAVTLALPGAAIIARLTRTNLAAVFKEDYITTARAKGMPGRIVLFKHALPNVMLPVITIVGLQFGNLMTGTVIVETVFSRPGIGRMGVNSILTSDYPVVQGFALVIAATYVVANLVVDLVYTWIDPRIRYD
jgi:peptide/nickel transport system permease protein/oligopeptide transport system permease protein